MSGPHGKFVWYELMTTDTAAAEKFYCGVIGWRAQDAGMAGMSYTLFKAGQTFVGGMMALPENCGEAVARPGWIGYVAVDDVDATAAEVTKGGGKVQRAPDDIPGVGRFAIVSDPQGATLALFKGSGEEQGQLPAPGTPGTGGWHELLASNQEAALSYYAKLFGWSRGEAMNMGPMGVYQIFTLGDQMLGGMMTKPDSVPAPFWLYYFNIAGIDAAAERVKAGGGEICNGQQEVPGGHWIVQCKDPQGGMFALVAPRAGTGV